MWSELVDARIDATVGLHMSQPFPVPKRSIRPEKVRMSVADTISNSSLRDWLKCSHSDFDCSTPSASSNFLSSGTQEPQEVPALVHAFRPGTSQQPPAMASVRSPLVTLLQEHICAAAGSAPTPSWAAPPSLPAGAMRAIGSPGSSSPTIGRSIP